MSGVNKNVIYIGLCKKLLLMFVIIMIYFLLLDCDKILYYVYIFYIGNEFREVEILLVGI